MPSSLPRSRSFIIGAAVFGLALRLGGAAADPFPWADAEVATGGERLVDGDQVRFRSGSLLLGDRFDIAVALTTASGGEQEIVRTMADSLPRIAVRGDLIEVRWTVFPMGAEAERVVAACFGYASGRSAYVERPCADADQHRVRFNAAQKTRRQALRT